MTAGEAPLPAKIGGMRLALALAVFALATPALAATKVATETSPDRSRNGEPIQFRILIVHDGNETVVPPRLPQLADFDLVNAYNTPTITTIIQNGRMIRRFKGEYVYRLKPLRAGKLKVPPVEFYVGATKFTTDPQEITVDKLPGRADYRDRLHGNNSAPSQPSMPGHGFRTDPSYDPTVNPRETFFLRAEPSKTNVYQGELIVLSYALYQRDRNLDSPEIAKFPDFKGFLKEELVTPKTFAAQPFELNGTMYLRSEIFRYAVFPLRSGKLKIEPMKFRANVFTNPIDQLQRFMMGQVPNPPTDDGVIPMVKTSREIEVDVKPLPASPADAQFTGAVGDFKLEVKAPTGKLSVGNPFSVMVTFAGRGNVKAIEPPTLSLPGALELTRVPVPSYEFREDASGFKTFDYLIEPRAGGTYTLEGLRWSYFDPEKGQYVTLAAPPMELKIEGGAAAPLAESKDTPAAPAFGAVETRPGRWERIDSIGRPSFVGGPAGWAFNGLLFAFLSVVAWRRRSHESEEALYRRAPWERTARRIRELKDGNAVTRAILVDEWIRERLAGLVGRSEIHGESARDEILDALRSMLHTEHHKQLEPLKRLWHELDLLRFTGASGRPQGGADVYERAKALVESLVKVTPEREDEGSAEA